MSIYIDLSKRHMVKSAQAHYYREPTRTLYIDRIMPYHDLVYLVDGQWVITENEIEYPLGRDDVLLLSAGRHHYTRLPCAPETRTMCIHVSCEEGSGQPLSNNIQLPTLIHLRGATMVKQYFEEIIATMWSECDNKKERMSALFDLIVCELVDFQKSKKTLKPNLIQNVNQILNDNPQRLLRAYEIASMLNITSKNLEKSLRNTLGMSFSTYQMNRKLNMVALMLETNPDLRLKEIADALGFCDEFHMSRSFKRRYTISPKEFRKQFLDEIVHQEINCLK